MKLEFVYDCETTGFPIWKIPSDDERQPHIVQLGALLVDLDTRKVVSSLDLIVKPDGWEIPDEVAKIHGITTEYAKAVGVDEDLALNVFLQMCGDRVRVAHNRTFDQRIIRIATKRFCTDEAIDRWAEKSTHECTMMQATRIMGGKWPTLEEAYTHFTGKKLQNAHQAMADATACMELYFSMKDIADAGIDAPRA